MARTIDASNDALLNSNPTVVPQADGSIFFWFKPAWNSGDGVIHYLFHCTSPTASHELRIEKRNTNVMRVGWLQSSDNDLFTVSDSGLFTSGTWCNICLTWSDSANVATLYHNGSQIVQRTDPLATWSADLVGGDLLIGNSVSLNLVSNGDFAEFGMWSSVLTPAEITSLHRGFSPALISPSTLDMYCPINGKVASTTTEVNWCGDAISTTGAALDPAVHPRIFYPATMQLGGVGAGGDPPAVGNPSALLAWF